MCFQKLNWNIPCVGHRYKKTRQGEFREFHGCVWSLLGHFRRESHGFGEQETISHALYNLWFVIFTNFSNLCSFYFCIHHNLKQTLSTTDYFRFYFIHWNTCFEPACDSLWLHMFNICAPCFLAQWFFPVTLHHAVLYLLNKALLGFGTSCASWQRERKWKENVAVTLPTAIQQIRTEKRGMCAFTDGVLQHPVLNAVSHSVLTKRTVLAPWCSDGDMNMKWSEEGRGFRTGCRSDPNQHHLDKHHSSVFS